MREDLQIGVMTALSTLTAPGVIAPRGVDERFDEALTLIYRILFLLFAESRDLVDDAEWLANQLHELMPTEPEVAGLLALIQLHRAGAPGEVRRARRSGFASGPGPREVESRGHCRCDPPTATRGPGTPSWSVSAAGGDRRLPR